MKYKKHTVKRSERILCRLYESDTTMKITKVQYSNFQRINAKLDTVAGYYLMNLRHILKQSRKMLRPKYLVNVPQKLKLVGGRAIIVFRSFRRRGLVRVKKPKNQIRVMYMPRWARPREKTEPTILEHKKKKPHKKNYKQSKKFRTVKLYLTNRLKGNSKKVNITVPELKTTYSSLPIQSCFSPDVNTPENNKCKPLVTEAANEALTSILCKSVSLPNGPIIETVLNDINSSVSAEHDYSKMKDKGCNFPLSGNKEEGQTTNLSCASEHSNMTSLQSMCVLENSARQTNMERNCILNETVSNKCKANLELSTKAVGFIDKLCAETQTSAGCNPNVVNTLVKPKVRESKIRPDKNDQTPAELNNKLREQLSFFKMGKRKETILGENLGGTRRVSSAEASQTSTPSFSRHVSVASIEDSMIRSNNKPAQTQAATTHNTPDTNEYRSNESRVNFIDSLINRFKLNSGIDTTPEKPSEKPVAKEPKTNVKIIDDASDHSDSNDFFGFNMNDDSEFTNPTIPGLLATPVVPKSSVKSAFVSEALDNFMKENALENSANIDIPVARNLDDALISIDTKPPNMTCPQLPQNMEKPRTVAAKREQLQGHTDIKFLMIENESTVFRELKKRSRPGGVVNYRHIRWLQDHNIPFTRDCWRATSWLATRMGKFYYQTIRTESGQQVNIFSGTGNHTEKTLFEFPKNCPKLDSKATRCNGKCRPIDYHLRINNIHEFLNSISPSTAANKVHQDDTPTSTTVALIKLNTLAACTPTTTGPLSKKLISDQRSSVDLELGPLQVFNLPSVHLEIWPRLEDPLPDHIRPYLKMALPFHCLTAKWVNFALTALKVPLKENYTSQRGRSIQKSSYNEDTLGNPENAVTKLVAASEPKSFVFDIPYANDQRRLLIRKRKQLLSLASAYPDRLVDDKDTLTFDQTIDRRDLVAVDVSNVLRSMFDTVSISVNELNFIKADPDDDRAKSKDFSSFDRAQLKTNNRLAALTLRRPSVSATRIRNELKRLNATIIDNFVEPAKVNCTEEHCKKGCVCDSLRVSRNYQQHCKKIQCMFNCVCSQKSLTALESRNSNIEQLCYRATAYMAKEEKEFRATVVLSEDQTIYIPNQENVGKRNKRVPKRFHDSATTNDLLFSASTKRLRPNAADSTLEKTDVTDVSNNTNKVAAAVDVTPKRTRLQAELDRISHCSVSVFKMPDFPQLEPWCMVHHLYKCFCKLKATTGTPFKFQDADVPMVPPEEYYPPPKKRQYTFEKTPNEETHANHSDVAPNEELHSARTKPITLGRAKRSRAEIEKMHAMYRKIEQDNRGLKKLLNNRKMRCSMGSGEMYAVDNDKSTKKNGNNANKTHSASLKRSSAAKLLKRVSLLKPISPPAAPQPVSLAAAVDAPTPESLNATIAPTNSSKLKHQHNLKYFNYCVNRTMEQIRQTQIKTEIVKPPVQRTLCCIQWTRFIELFRNDRIFAWEIQLHTLEVILGVTVENVMPLVPGALSAMNIKVIPNYRLPYVAKMLKENKCGAETKQMAVLLHGASNYWKLISVVHSTKNYMEQCHRVQPTPGTHPQLATKIAALFQMLTQNRGQNKRSAAASSSTGSSPASSAASAASRTQHHLHQEQRSTTIVSVPRCNIKMTTDRNIESFFLAIPKVGAHKWLMMTVGNDFTHLFIRSWKSFLSFDKIRNALTLATSSKKTVKISAPNIIPDVYAAPNQPNKVFFGPYTMDALLDMILYKEVDGRLIPINEMEAGKKQNRTRGCWLCMKETAQESEVNMALGGVASAKHPILVKEQDSDDDDCMIIENNSSSDVIAIADDDIELNAEEPTKDGNIELQIEPVVKMISLSPPPLTAIESPTPEVVVANFLPSTIDASPGSSKCDAVSNIMAACIQSTQLDDQHNKSGHSILRAAVTANRREKPADTTEKTKTVSSESQSADVGALSKRLLSVDSSDVASDSKGNLKKNGKNLLRLGIGPHPSALKRLSENGITVREIIELVSDDEQPTTATDEPPKTTGSIFASALTASDLNTFKGKGWMISNVGKALGRVEAHVHSSAIVVTLNNLDHKGLKDFAKINDMLNQHIRKQVYAFEPRNFCPTWHFIPDCRKDSRITAYPVHKASMFSATTVITENGLIDLHGDFETVPSMPRELLLRLLVLKLAHLCKCDRDEVRNRTFNDILRKGEAYVKALIRRESKYEKTKMSYAVKLHLNKVKLAELHKKHGKAAAAAAEQASKNDVDTGDDSKSEYEVIEIVDDDDDDDDP